MSYSPSPCRCSPKTLYFSPRQKLHNYIFGHKNPAQEPVQKSGPKSEKKLAKNMAGRGGLFLPPPVFGDFSRPFTTMTAMIRMTIAKTATTMGSGIMLMMLLFCVVFPPKGPKRYNFPGPKCCLHGRRCCQIPFKALQRFFQSPLGV